MVGSVSISVPASPSSYLQALYIGQDMTGSRGSGTLSECGERARGGRNRMIVRSLSLQSRETSGSDPWSRREEAKFRDLSIGRRPQRPETVRALNSAQYRLEKEREKGGDKENEDDDEDLCPIECVREFSTQAEFDHLLEQAKEEDSLVVVDFFRTACGSCKYIEKGFVKLCKGAGNSDAHVMFLKHNVMDEYEEQSEVADRLRIKVVPLFHFYRDGVLVESFATREKAKILAAISKHTNLKLTLADFELGGK